MNRLMVVMLLGGCQLTLGPGAGGDGGTGGGSGAPPPINTTLLGTGAVKLLADVGNAKLELDPTVKDPLSALAECADLLSYCYAPGSATLSQCFERLRKCTTDTPWSEAPCCPAACQTAYEAELSAGKPPAAALEKVLFREPDCFPGVRAALETP
ncbi:MAG: hypothetical protein IPJ65_33925 [Archangiaceae bacterium]|nr:hypothetical protein [Archangiaceae bacterium]